MGKRWLVEKGTLFEKEKIFIKWQNGFKKMKRFAMQHVFRLVEETQLEFTKKWKGGAIFMDVEKAFDSVWHDRLRYKLMNGIFQNECPRLALGLSSYDRTRLIDLHALTNVSMIKTKMTTLAVKTFRSLENSVLGIWW